MKVNTLNSNRRNGNKETKSEKNEKIFFKTRSNFFHGEENEYSIEDAQGPIRNW